MALSRKQTLIAGIILIALHLVTLFLLARTVPPTGDEPIYFSASQAILEDFKWQSKAERFQGPLPLLANQLLVNNGDAPLEKMLPASRTGMLPFSLLLLLVVWLWGWEAWGRGGGLLALIIATLCPNLLGYGSLIAVDLSLTAMITLTFWLHWRWLRQPCLIRLTAWAAALGLALATKYLALLLALAIPLLTLIAAIRGTSLFPFPGGLTNPIRRLGQSLLALLVAAPISLFMLHSAYLFQAPFFDPATSPLASTMLQNLAALPGGNWLLQLLPEPLVLGADYQQAISTEFTGKFLDYNSTHLAYYPVALLTKIPIPAQILFWFALLVPGKKKRPPQVALSLALPALLLFLFLVLGSKIQTGIRYLLPLLPLLAITAGAWINKIPSKRILHCCLTTAMLLWLTGTAIFTWPHYLAYFNQFTGGQKGAFRLFSDSNCEWWQNHDSGKKVLTTRYPDLKILGPASGPRFGKVAVYVQHLKPADPERPGRTYHWLTRFTPCDHYAAAWYVFNLKPANYQTAINRGDERAARDLAIAHLGGGKLKKARQALSLSNNTQQKKPIMNALIALENLAAEKTNATRQNAARCLASLGLLEQALIIDPDAKAVDQATLLYLAGHRDQALQLLITKEKNNPLTMQETLYLSYLLFETGCPREAIDALNRNQPSPGSPLLEKWRAMEKTIREALQERSK